MQRSEFDFDVISGPSSPTLAFRSPAAAPSPQEAAPAPPASLDPAPARTESPKP